LAIHADDPRVARLYRDVPPELVARLHAFRARHPYRRATVAGTQWRYIDAGEGEEVLLAPAGGTCIAETNWLSIEHFAERFRVISPDYPPLDTMAELVDGIAGLLDRERIERAHVLGGSYGGFVAQVFVRRHPGRTASLILSHTLLPTREGAERVAKAERWMRLLPASALKALFRLRLAKLFPKRADAELALSRAHLAEIIRRRVTKAQLVSLLRRVADLGLNYRFAPEDLRGWPGRVLLLMAEDDPATPKAVREAMTAMYPAAQVRLFAGAGHLTALLQRDEYLAVIDEFLRQAAASTPPPCPPGAR
jgi:pimeloyl-ACP methyl ester carboxylesterase